MIMKNIEKLISLEEDEEILGIFETEDKLCPFFDIKLLNQEYHKIEDLPTSFFNITENNISFVETHIFTNKRYITVGINFWQLYDSNCKKNLEKIKIENFILSIKREYLQTIKFELNRFENSIILSGMVKLNSDSREQYEILKKFLVEQWNFQQSDINLKENQVISEEAKLIHILCLAEISAAIIVVFANALYLIYLEEFFLLHLIILIFYSIWIIFSIIEILSLRSKQQIYKYLISSQSRFFLYLKSLMFLGLITISISAM